MATIQGVYVALFGRPADPTGLAYFNSVTKNGADLKAIANLAGQKEYIDRFSGMTNVQIINTIYQSLFGRDADLAGLNFFADALSKGTLTVNNIAIAILDGAQGNDKTVSGNKIAAADLYTKALDTGSEVVAYTGNAAAAQGVAFLKAVTTTVPTAAAVDTAVATMVTASTNGGTGAAGVTLTLTDKADTLASNAGSDASKTTAGNDTIRGVTAGDLGTADSIDGGAGTDTLNAAMSAGPATPSSTTPKTTTVAPVIKNVEVINLDYSANSVAGAVKFDANGVSGAQSLVISGVKIAAATSNYGTTTTPDNVDNTFTVDNVEKSTTVQLKNVTIDDSSAGNALTAGATVNFRDADGSSDSATVSLAKVTVGGTTTKDVFALTVAKIENLTVDSTGDANSATLKAVDAAKLVVTGDKDLTLVSSGTNGADNAKLKTVDASAFTGKLTYTATNNGETISGGTKADTITLGNGNDTVVYTAANKSTLTAMDTIASFDFDAKDKFDLKAFNLASGSTVGTSSVALTGDSSGFFSGTDKVMKYHDTNTNTAYIYVDANGDGNFNASSDLVIKVTGVNDAAAFAKIDKADFSL